MPKYDGSIRINTKIETKDLNSQMMRVSNAIKKDSAALDSLNRKMEEFSQKKIPTEKFAELQRELEKAESEYSKLQARMSQKGADFNPRSREWSDSLSPTLPSCFPDFNPRSREWSDGIY